MTAVVIPAQRTAVRVLTGAEVLDLSRITLADLVPAPAPTAVAPVAPIRPRAYDEALFDDGPAAPVVAPDLDLLHTYRAAMNRHPLLDGAVEEAELAHAIEVGVLAQERLADDATTAAEHRDLTQLVRNGRRAFDRFLTGNLRLVHVIALQYQHRGLDLLDLVQEGGLGLIRAVQKFDHRQGTTFSTYATWWIRQSITRALADQTRTIRYPVHVVEDLTPVLRVRRELRTSGRDDSPAAVAEEAGRDEAEVRKLLELPVCVPLDDIDPDVAGELAARYAPVHEPDLMGFDPGEPERLLAVCNDREQAVLRRRHGLSGDPATLDVIGGELGVTRERIRQIEGKALTKVRAAAADRSGGGG